MISKVFFFIILINISPTFAQSNLNKNFKLGVQFYSNHEYSEAIKYFKKATNEKGNNIEAWQYLADSYRLSRKPEFAEPIYKKLIANNTNIKNYFYYGLVLQSLGKYSDSKKYFYKYINLAPGDSIVKDYLAACDSSSIWEKAMEKYQIKNERKINSPFSEIAPVAYNGDLVFSSSREGTRIRYKSKESSEPFYDLYVAELLSTNCWGKPKSFSPSINTFYNEGAATFSKGFDTIYFTSNGKNEGQKQNLKLYLSFRKGLFWSTPESFIMNDSIYSFGHPSLSKDGKIFFFASDMPGGFGGTDIYICVKKDSIWSLPFNLGSTVNTSGNELYPFYHSNGTLYFCSDRHPGLGGFDIFYSYLTDDGWDIPQNLKRPINSSYDDVSIFIKESGTEGFFSSNRPGGMGKEDIYFFHKKD